MKEERNMKIKLNNISETMLITLYMRATDAKSEKPILNDKKSEEIISQIDYDFSKFKSAWASYYGVLSRAKVMDNEVKVYNKISRLCNCVDWMLIRYKIFTNR